MSKKRIISECINVRVNVGNYQHIEITKQAQEEIEYENDQERLDLEQNLTNDLIDGVIKSMRTLPERLGKGVENAQEVEESISKAIPEWLDKQPPNLIDKTKEQVNKVALEQKDNKDRASEDILDVDGSSSLKDDLLEEDDLFEEDEPPVKSEVEEIKESPSESTPIEKKKEVVSVGGSTDDTFDFYDDDDMDLFND